MEIQAANLRDLGSLRRLEQVCFEKDAWPLLDLIAVLSWPEVIKLKAVENGEMIGFVAGDKSDHFPIFHSLQFDYLRPAQHRDQIQQGPGIFFEANLFEPA